MARDIDVQDATTIVPDDEETIEDAERDRGHGEEIHRRDGFAMVPQEGKPPFGWFGIPRCAVHPSGNRSLRYIESQHPEFTVNAWRAPGGVLGDHPEDQIAYFLRDAFPSDQPARSGNRAPIEHESS